MEKLLNQILSELQTMKKEIHIIQNDISTIKDDQLRIEQKVDGIYNSVVRIEEGQPKDIYAMLENIGHKLDNKDAEIAVLNKRVFKVETDIENLNKQ